MRSVIARRNFARQIVSSPILTCAALSFATILSGCMYSPYSGGYGYGGGGYSQQGGYPGTYPQYGAPQYGTPIQTLTPGQQYVPGQVYPQGTIPQGSFPSTNPGTPTYNTPGGLQPIPDNTSNAPSFNSGNVTTPDPYFPSASTNSALSPIADNSFQSSVQPANHSEHSQYEPLDGLQSVPSQNPMAGAYAEPEATPTFGGNPDNSETQFQPPVAASSNPFETATPTQSAPAPDQAMPVFSFEKVTPGQLDPYGHEPNFQWLRGVVSHDSIEGSWSIVYDDNPAENDQHAGHITLAQSPYLNQLEEGAVVEIQGEVDSVAKDAQGKPVYLIRSVTELAKSAAQ